MVKHHSSLELSRLILCSVHRCEYILYRGVYRTAYARVSRGTITDTELQIGQFTLPRHGAGVVNETRDARYLRVHKEKLPAHHVGLFNVFFSLETKLRRFVRHSGSLWRTMEMKTKVESMAISIMYSERYVSSLSLFLASSRSDFICGLATVLQLAGRRCIVKCYCIRRLYDTSQCKTELVW